MVWINRLYIFFLGIILSITTGFGLAAFYPQPIAPTYPTIPYSPPIPQSCYSTPQEEGTPNCQTAIQKNKQFSELQDAQQQSYQQKFDDYNNANAGYTRTAIFFGVTIGAIFSLVGIVLIKFSRLIANGLLFAGLITAILARLLINLASLGQMASGTSSIDITSIAEFVVLVILSLAVVVVGFVTLKEKTT